MAILTLMKNRYLILLFIILWVPSVVIAACEYTYETVWSGSQGTKMTILVIPDGFANDTLFDPEADLVCSDVDTCASSKLFYGNYFDGTAAGYTYPPRYTKQYFNVVRVSDNGECSGNYAVWSATCKSSDCLGSGSDNTAMATLLHAVMSQAGAPLTDCNFLSSKTCKTLPVVIVNQTSVAGGTKTSGTESWTSIGKIAGSADECEVLHEFGHVGFTDILGDEYNADNANPITQPCYGVTTGQGAALGGAINLINGNYADPNPPMNPVTKWNTYEAGAPFEGGAYCNEDVWRPTETSIMMGASTSCNFHKLGIEAINKGLDKRLGVITDLTAPTFTEITVGGTTIAGTTQKGTITITATPTDASGIAFVELSIACGDTGDTNPTPRHFYAGFDTTSPYTFEVDTTRWRDDTIATEHGCYALARAWDIHWNSTAVNPEFEIVNGLLAANDLTYVGRFKFPAGETCMKDGMTYKPGTPGTLFVTDKYAVAGSPTCPGAAEIDLPTDEELAATKTSSYTSLHAVSFVAGQGWTEITNSCSPITACCNDKSNNPCLSSVAYFPAFADGLTGFAEDKLLYGLYDFYTPENSLTDGSIGWSNLDFSSLTQAGNWYITPVNKEGTGSYITYLPASVHAWADANHGSGYYIMTGSYRNVYSGFSCGPSAYLIRPQTHCTNNDCEGTPPAAGAITDARNILLYDCTSDETHKLIGATTGTDRYHGGGWVTYGGRSVMMLSANKSVFWSYDSSVSYKYEPPYGARSRDQYGSWGDYSGYHGNPMYSTLMFWNPTDLGDIVTTWDQPYMRLVDTKNTFNKSIPGESVDAVGGAAAIDNDHGRIFVIETDVYTGGYDVAHVYQMSGVPGPIDKVPPTVPTGLTASITDGAATISWTASVERPDNTKVTYLIFINDVPTFLTNSTSIVHTNYRYYVPPVKYEIEAWDNSWNKSSTRAPIYVDNNTSGGNSPIFLTYPGNYVSAGGTGNYGNNYPPNGRIGEAYSVTPVIYGASGCTFASASLPEGLSISESTGVISGTPTTAYTMAPYTVTMTCGSSVIKRQLSFSIYNVSACAGITNDHDADGYNSEACGGTDTNDYDARVFPGSTVFSVTPTTVAVVGNTLSWTTNLRAEVWAYNVYSGTSTGNLSNQHFVGYKATMDLTGQTDTFWAVKAIDFKGMESALSGEQEYTGDSTPATFTGGSFSGGGVIK